MLTKPWLGPYVRIFFSGSILSVEDLEESCLALHVKSPCSSIVAPGLWFWSLKICFTWAASLGHHSESPSNPVDPSRSHPEAGLVRKVWRVGIWDHNVGDIQWCSGTICRAGMFRWGGRIMYKVNDSNMWTHIFWKWEASGFSLWLCCALSIKKTFNWQWYWDY